VYISPRRPRIARLGASLAGLRSRVGLVKNRRKTKRPVRPCELSHLLVPFLVSHEQRRRRRQQQAAAPELAVAGAAARAGRGAGPLRAQPHRVRRPAPVRRRVRVPEPRRDARVQLQRLVLAPLRRRRPAGAHPRRLAAPGGPGASSAEEPERGHGADRRGPAVRVRFRRRRWGGVSSQEPELRRRAWPARRTEGQGARPGRLTDMEITATEHYVRVHRWSYFLLLLLSNSEAAEICTGGPELLCSYPPPCLMLPCEEMKL
jgi:hypothetical protein